MFYIDLNGEPVATYNTAEEAKEAFYRLHATLPHNGRNAYGLHFGECLVACSEDEWDGEDFTAEAWD